VPGPEPVLDRAQARRPHYDRQIVRERPQIDLRRRRRRRRRRRKRRRRKQNTTKTHAVEI